MALLKQSTARERMVFMVDDTDHVTGAEGLTLAIEASKNGGAFSSISPTVTERGDGWYSLLLTTSHTDTLGDFALHITATGADPTDVLDEVVADLPGASVSSVGTGGITASSIATGAIDADALATDAVNEIWAKAMTEPSAVPGVTATAAEVLAWLLVMTRNKRTQSTTAQTLRNNADSGNIATAAVSQSGSGSGAVTTFDEWA